MRAWIQRIELKPRPVRLHILDLAQGNERIVRREPVAGAHIRAQAVGFIPEIALRQVSEQMVMPIAPRGRTLDHDHVARLAGVAPEERHQPVVRLILQRFDQGRAAERDLLPESVERGPLAIRQRIAQGGDTRTDEGFLLRIDHRKAAFQKAGRHSKRRRSPSLFGTPALTGTYLPISFSNRSISVLTISRLARQKSIERISIPKRAAIVAASPRPVEESRSS